METWECPDCGASITPEADQCAYCGNYFRRQPVAEQEPGQSDDPSAGSKPTAGTIFQRRTEANEGAFSLSVPQDWLIEGGIFRADLMHQTIDAQSIQPKLDFAVKKDAAGSVQIRWGPEIRYCDLCMTPAGMMGMFPPGSYYQGMMVSPVMPAEEFLVQFAFPWAHP
jgi:hypothetical protein